uniref:hypothetical protein n=1 Tax=Shewanella sp. TaxID=50422 RepID=UPI00404720CF
MKIDMKNAKTAQFIKALDEVSRKCKQSSIAIAKGIKAFEEADRKRKQTIADVTETNIPQLNDNPPKKIIFQPMNGYESYYDYIDLDISQYKIIP